MPMGQAGAGEFDAGSAGMMARWMKRLKPEHRRLLLALLVLVLSIGLAIFVLFLVQLDKEIRARFAGSRWALPAQVYAAPLELYPGLPLGAADLRQELVRLGYRAGMELSGPGTFTINSQRVQAHIRSFHFWDGAQPESRIALDLAPQAITAISDIDSGQPRELLRLDPMLIGSIYPQHGEDRVLVRLEDVPELLPQGLIAVEDRGFHSHFGISFRGIFRAALANLMAGQTVQGASTLTQQLVKNFFLTPDRNLRRKLKEMLMALLLEAHYSKDEILEAYLNEIQLGQDGGRSINGFGLGAQFFFNKPVSELRSHEIALLVGVAKGTTYYSPRRNPQRAQQRRDLVLGIFREAGLIDDAEYKSAIARPLGLAGRSSQGAASYPAFIDLVKRQIQGQYQDADLTSEGLRIFTTLDPRAQEALETRIVEALPQLEASRKLKPDTLQAAGVITSVNGGEVLALVAGRDPRFAGYNRALDTRRSIGSLAKPFVYLAALMQPASYNLHTILPDEPVELKLPNRTTWAPQNYDRQLHGPQPLYLALAQSYNLPTVALGLQVGPDKVLAAMRDAGYSGNAQPLPSNLLGAIDIAPLEVAQMYTTLAAGGYQSPLSAIREVQTKEGEPLERYPITVRQTLPEAPAYLLTWALNKVMTLGTGRAAYNIIQPDVALAGKTGTTDDLRDAWFAGYGSDRVGVVWVGRDDYQPMGLTGASGALPIWARTMRDLRVRGLDLVPPGRCRRATHRYRDRPARGRALRRCHRDALRARPSARGGRALRRWPQPHRMVPKHLQLKQVWRGPTR